MPCSKGRPGNQPERRAHYSCDFSMRKRVRNSSSQVAPRRHRADNARAGVIPSTERKQRGPKQQPGQCARRCGAFVLRVGYLVCHVPRRGDGGLITHPAAPGTLHFAAAFRLCKTTPAGARVGLPVTAVARRNRLRGSGGRSRTGVEYRTRDRRTSDGLSAHMRPSQGVPVGAFKCREGLACAELREELWPVGSGPIAGGGALA